LTPALAREGWQVTVAVPDDAVEAAGLLAAAGARVERIPLARVRKTRDPREHARLMLGLVPQVRALARIVEREGIEIVVNNGLMNPHAALAGRLRRVPVVWQVIDVSAPAPVRRAYVPAMRGLADALMSNGTRILDGYPGLAAAFAGRRTSWIGPVDTAAFAPPEPAAKALARERLGLDSASPVVGMVANFSPEKDHPTFVRAAAALRAALPDARFVLVGRTYAHREPELDALHRLAADLGVPFGSVIEHRVAETDVSRIAAAFDVFWLTSRAEAATTAVAEAMAMGLPVVASNVGGLPDVVEDGVTGRLVPAGDAAAFAEATAELLRDPAARGAMSGAARERAVRDFDTAACAAAHLSAFALAAQHRAR
jgi:hypothetical protein